MLHSKFRENCRFWRRRFLSGFYPIWAWRPSLSCDQDIANKIQMPLPKEAPYKISIGQAVSEKNIFEIVDDGRTDRRRTNDGSWPSCKLT